MQNKKHIAAITLWVLIMTPPMALATGPIVPDKLPDRATNLISSSERQTSIVLAESESSNPAGREDSKAESGSNGSQAEKESKTNSTTPATEEKKASLKSFVPSEKIPAEQAVDFPVDI